MATSLVQAAEDVVIKTAEDVATGILKDGTKDLKSIENSVAKDAVHAAADEDVTFMDKVEGAAQIVANEIVKGAQNVVTAVEEHPELIAEGGLAVAVGAMSLIQPELLAGEVAILGKMAGDSAKASLTKIAQDEGKKVVAAISKDIADDTKKTEDALDKKEEDTKAAEKAPLDAKLATVAPTDGLTAGEEKSLSAAIAAEVSPGQVGDKVVTLELDQPGPASDPTVHNPITLKITVGADGQVKGVAQTVVDKTEEEPKTEEAKTVPPPESKAIEILEKKKDEAPKSARSESDDVASKTQIEEAKPEEPKTEEAPNSHEEKPVSLNITIGADGQVQAVTQTVVNGAPAPVEAAKEVKESKTEETIPIDTLAGESNLEVAKVEEVKESKVEEIASKDTPKESEKEESKPQEAKSEKGKDIKPEESKAEDATSGVTHTEASQKLGENAPIAVLASGAAGAIAAEVLSKDTDQKLSEASKVEVAKPDKESKAEEVKSEEREVDSSKPKEVKNTKAPTNSETTTEPPPIKEVVKDAEPVTTQEVAPELATPKEILSEPIAVASSAHAHKKIPEAIKEEVATPSKSGTMTTVSQQHAPSAVEVEPPAVQQELRPVHEEIPAKSEEKSIPVNEKDIPGSRSAEESTPIEEGPLEVQKEVGAPVEADILAPVSEKNIDGATEEKEPEPITEISIVSKEDKVDSTPFGLAPIEPKTKHEEAPKQTTEETTIQNEVAKVQSTSVKIAEPKEVKLEEHIPSSLPDVDLTPIVEEASTELKKAVEPSELVVESSHELKTVETEEKPIVKETPTSAAPVVEPSAPVTQEPVTPTTKDQSKKEESSPKGPVAKELAIPLTIEHTPVPENSEEPRSASRESTPSTSTSTELKAAEVAIPAVLAAVGTAAVAKAVSAQSQFAPASLSPTLATQESIDHLHKKIDSMTEAIEHLTKTLSAQSGKPSVKAAVETMSALELTPKPSVTKEVDLVATKPSEPIAKTIAAKMPESAVHKESEPTINPEPAEAKQIAALASAAEPASSKPAEAQTPVEEAQRPITVTVKSVENVKPAASKPIETSTPAETPSPASASATPTSPTMPSQPTHAKRSSIWRYVWPFGGSSNSAEINTNKPESPKSTASKTTMEVPAIPQMAA